MFGALCVLCVCVCGLTYGLLAAAVAVVRYDRLSSTSKLQSFKARPAASRTGECCRMGEDDKEDEMVMMEVVVIVIVITNRKRAMTAGGER